MGIRSIICIIYYIDSSRSSTTTNNIIIVRMSLLVCGRYIKIIVTYLLQNVIDGEDDNNNNNMAKTNVPSRYRWRTTREIPTDSVTVLTREKRNTHGGGENRKTRNAKRRWSARACALLQRLWKPLETVVVGVCSVYNNYTIDGPVRLLRVDVDDDDDE